MYTRAEVLALKTSGQVQTAIGATDGTNSAVATNLGLKRWLVVWLRKLYNLTRV